MTQIGGVFSFPLLEAAEEGGKHMRLPISLSKEPQIPHHRASYRRYPSTLTSEIKINGAAEGFFYVLE